MKDYEVVTLFMGQKATLRMDAAVFSQIVDNRGIMMKKTAFSGLCVCNSVSCGIHNCTYFLRLIQCVRWCVITWVKETQQNVKS
jgi:hypothetical protein